MNLFNMGGVLFMSLLSIELLVMTIFVIKSFLAKEDKQKHVDTAKSVGLLALVTGVLGQLIGLYDALKAIEVMGQVSPAMLAGGIKVSMITTLYGLLIYVISLLSYIGIKILK